MGVEKEQRKERYCLDCECSQWQILSLVTILSGFEINNFAEQPGKPVCYTFAAMFNLFRLWFGAVIRIFRAQRSLMLENLALRQLLVC